MAVTREDVMRELVKARDALTGCQTYLERFNEANAALHCADVVRYSPLTAQVHAAVDGLDLAIERLEIEDTEGVPT